MLNPDDYQFMPIDQATMLQGGMFRHIVGSWWQVCPERGLVFYRLKGDRRRWGSPQCNTDRAISERVARHTPFPVEIRWVERVFVPTEPGEYK